VSNSASFRRVGRAIIIYTNTRKLTLMATNVSDAVDWHEKLTEFYAYKINNTILRNGSSFPIRDNVDVRLYTLSMEYFAAAAVAMLGAKEEILIASWKMSPSLLLTRPPLPPIRLDQILKFKADMGVKVYVLLYKEVNYNWPVPYSLHSLMPSIIHICQYLEMVNIYQVELSGQGNKSYEAKEYLESLSENIRCIRHPNKLLGGSTAVLWSHHEKLLVVDRNTAFVGGIDFAYGRWEDSGYRLEDEDGVLYPGDDYRQPAPGLHVPVRQHAPKWSNNNNNNNTNTSTAGLDNRNSVFRSTVITEAEAVRESAITITSVYAESKERRNFAAFLDGPETEEERVIRLQAERGEFSIKAVEVVSSRSSSFGGETSYISASKVPAQHATSLAEGQVVGAVQYYASPPETEPKEESARPSLFQYIQESIGSLAGFTGNNSSNNAIERDSEVREMYPRMAWHDAHARVTGGPARDISAHFIQRWNHHRLAKV
jgi:phospholipase D1/2